MCPQGEIHNCSQWEFQRVLKMWEKPMLKYEMKFSVYKIICNMIPILLKNRHLEKQVEKEYSKYWL